MLIYFDDEIGVISSFYEQAKMYTISFSKID